MNVKHVVEALEQIAPPSLAAEWDNVGLLAGDAAAGVRKAMLCIDLTVGVLAEALAARCRMVVAYHPPIFKPIRRVTADREPVVYQAVRRGIAVYAVHTALDAAPQGTHDALADVLDLANRRPMEPSAVKGQCKVVAFVPQDDFSRVAQAAFDAGAGRIGRYRDCAFYSPGTGAFLGEAGAHPAVGKAGRRETVGELRLELICPCQRAGEVCAAIRDAHSYETPAIDVYPVDDYPQDCGLGRIGDVPRALSLAAAVARIKKRLGLPRVMLARAAGKPQPIRTVACGAGSCGELFRAAIAGGAQLYLTGEMRHHDLLAAAAAGLNVVCLGHSHSERLALPGLAARLADACRGLDVIVSKTDRDPMDIV